MTLAAVVEHHAMDARRYWRSVLISGLLSPMAYVLALGIGLGTVVDRNGGDSLGVPYLVFVAPAFLCATALTLGASEASYPVMSKFKWERTYHGMAATPLDPRHIADGTLVWIGLRLTLDCGIYFAIMAAFGGVQRWQALLAIPVAVLAGLAIAAPVAAFAASTENEGQGFNVLRRFIITPMFLFAGTFYPISKLPDWGQWVAYATPLYHATQLAREAAIGSSAPLVTLGHLAYLVVLLGAGVALTHRYFRIRLTK